SHPNPTPDARFGAAVALTSTRAFIGSPGDDAAAIDAGAVFVYTLPIIIPAAPALTLNAPSLEAFHHVGSAIAVSGPRTVVGTQAGVAYVYDLASATPAAPVAVLQNPRAGVPDRFGAAVAISGTRVVVGASGDDLHDNDPGRAYVFDLESA